MSLPCSTFEVDHIAKHENRDIRPRVAERAGGNKTVAAIVACSTKHSVSAGFRIVPQCASRDRLPRALHQRDDGKPAGFSGGIDAAHSNRIDETILNGMSHNSHLIGKCDETQPALFKARKKD